MKYKLDDFSPQSFERLAQSLCVAMLGDGTAIFGSGPDGAREATFEGEVPYPSEAERWNGYIVAQAKCRETPRGDIRDARWLGQQIKDDLNKFLDPRRKLRTPEYYLIITNVSLSPDPEHGGKKVVQKILAEYKAVIGYRDAVVVAAEEIERLLDKHDGIRKAYAAWTTPGDVLSILIDTLDRPHLKRLLPLALARDLRNERDARLRDAGQETIRPVYLDQVFVDLPLSLDDDIIDIAHLAQPTYAEEPNDLADGLFDLPEHDSRLNESGYDLTKVAGRIFHRINHKLDPISLAGGDKTKQKRHGLNRIVVMGGPGQGKSTIGQFIAQVQRARLLNRHTGAALTPETTEIIQPVLDQAATEGISFKGLYRFPIRIDLPGYADNLAKASTLGGTLTIISKIAENLVKSLDTAINVDDVRKWLAACPCVVIFDGLDEVPETSNRSEVIKAIEAFFDEVHLHNIDCLAVVTSRPQGYNNALNRRFWEHWEMAPLTYLEADRYAERLAAVRLSDIDRRTTILQELRKAFSDPTTRLLSTSPLQVAILFGIANLKGAVPQDRWELFNRYYGLLRDREAQKLGESASIIRDYKREIDALHYECGFILQSASEIAGGNRSFLTPEQFGSIIARILRDDEHDDATIASVVHQLSVFATNRLVLLSSRVEGEITFDVRSLQEYMAAAQITGGPSNNVIERLRLISSAAHWRHVFRIAASRIFSSADLSYMRQDIISICHAIDSGDMGDDERLVKGGSRLAADLLIDGVASSAPKLHKNLVRRALTILDLGPESIAGDLVNYYNDSTLSIYLEEISSRLVGGGSLPARGAAKLCAFLLGKVPSSLRDLESILNRAESAVLLAAFDKIHPDHLSDEAKEFIEQIQIKSGPLRSATYGRRLLNNMFGNKEVEPDAYIRCGLVLPYGFYSETRQYFQSSKSKLSISFEPTKISRSVNFRIKSIDTTDLFILNRTDLLDLPNWRIMSSVNRFCEAPNKRTLAAACVELHALDRRAIDLLSLPWPLDSALRDLSEGNLGISKIDEIENGRFGDIQD